MIEFLKKHKLITTITSVLLVLVVVGVTVFNNPPDALLKFVIDKGVEIKNANSVIEEDGLYVITTGTGAPMPELDRVGSQTLVVAGDEILAFDAGPGSTLNFTLTGVPIDELDALFLTHYHSDHIGDIGELALKRWAGDVNDKPLDVYGPPGVDEVVNGFEMAYTLDKQYRVDHHGEETMPPSGFGYDINEFDLGKELSSSKVVYTGDELEVIAFNVDHAPIFPAVGYRVNYKDRSVVITGDTVYTESLTEHSKGADLLISEALDHELSQMVSDATNDNDNNLSVVAHDIQDYHIRTDEVGKVATDAGIDNIVITHILPTLPIKMMENAFINRVEKNYDGKVYLANDGTMIKMPVNSDKVYIKELLR